MSLQDLAYNAPPPDDQPARQPTPVSPGPTPEEVYRESWPPFTETGTGTTVGGQPAGAGLPPRQDPYIPIGPPTFPQSRDSSSWLGALANFWSSLNQQPTTPGPHEAIRRFLTGETQSGAQSVDESGMVFPPETAGRGGPGQPSPMQPTRQTEFPPSPLAGKPEPAEPPKPPEAKNAPPRQEPYIPSSRDTRPDAWGKPDLVERGMANYPPNALLPPPYGPQPHEWQGIMRRSTGFLGRAGSGNIMQIANSLLSLDSRWVQAQQRGEEQRTRIYAAQYAVYAKQLAQKQAEENREFAEAFAAYGPHDGSKGDEDALREAIHSIAYKNHDDNVLRVLDRGGWPAVQRMIAARDANGKDAAKTLIQIQRQNAIHLQEERLRKYEEERRRRQAADDAWMTGGGGGGGTPAGAMAPVGPTGTPGGAGDLEFDPHFGGPAAPAAAPADDGSKPTPEETVEPETPAEKTAPETSESDKPDQQSKTEDETKAAEAPSPSEEVLARAEGTNIPLPGAQPTRTAALETGTATDAPRPGALPTKAEAPDPPAAPPEPPPTRTASMAPAAGTPEAMGATAPVPSLQPREPTQPGAIPTGAPPGTPEQPLSTSGVENVAEPVYEWKRPRSAALDAVFRSRATRNPDGSVNSPNLVAIDTLAQQMINGTKKREELKQYPDWVLSAARQRGDEIAREMHDIAADPNIKTAEQVYTALRKINPEFADTLKAHVEGRKAVPNSAWANPGYSARLVQLGSKADPNFNEYTAKTRAATLKDAATGKLAQALTFTATAVRHLDHLEGLLKQRPTNWATRVLANFDTPGWVDKWLQIHPEDTAIMGALTNAINTANSEYERALVGGRPTVSGRKAQDAEVPLVYGRLSTMLANIRDKRIMLRDRLDELEDQFNAGTGMQPTAMYERFQKAQEGIRGNRERDMRDIQSLQAGGDATDPTKYGGFRRRGEPAEVPETPAARPPATTGAAPAAGSGNVVDWRTYFGR